jgi:uncharacterized membrane protein
MESSLQIFTDSTKKICTCTAISIMLILIFVLSPLSNIFLLSSFIKLITVFALIYAIYLNNQQIYLLQNAKESTSSSQIASQLNINIICSYTFTIFIGLLVFFVFKSLFS